MTRPSSSRAPKPERRNELFTTVPNYYQSAEMTIALKKSKNSPTIFYFNLLNDILAHNSEQIDTNKY